MGSNTLTNAQIKRINRLVEPFVEEERANNRPTAVGGIERGVVITMHDAVCIRIEIYKYGETQKD